MPFVRVLVLLFASVTMLTACAPRSENARSKTLGPQAALNAAGEPQWSLQLRGEQMRFSTGDAAPTVVKASRQDQGTKGVAWSGQAPAAAGKTGVQVSLVAVHKPCQDASTGLTYPLTAAVQVAGVRYAGCAAPAGQGLGPRS